MEQKKIQSQPADTLLINSQEQCISHSDYLEVFTLFLDIHTKRLKHSNSLETSLSQADVGEYMNVSESL